MAAPPAYKPVPTADPEHAQNESEKQPAARTRTRCAKNILLCALALCAIMLVALRPLRSVLRVPLRGSGARMGHGCHAAHRNLSTSALPETFALPSGDKIPSVALGTCACVGFQSSR